MDTEADPFKPQVITDLIGQWSRLESILKRADPPHIVLVGSAGVGKSCALRLCLSSAITVWLRCSSDPTLRDNRDWIVLEHADALHADAQAFLRRIIETTMGSTRFVLEVRDAAAIAEPLLSRTVLFTAPKLLEYEIRAEVMRRAPGLTLEKAQMYAETCDGNVRWAVLQGFAALTSNQGLAASQKTQGLALARNQGLAAPQQTQNDGFLGLPKKSPTTWSDVLRIMETIQATGSSPCAYSDQNSTVWDRPGGICPWALLGLELSKTII